MGSNPILAAIYLRKRDRLPSASERFSAAYPLTSTIETPAGTGPPRTPADQPPAHRCPPTMRSKWAPARASPSAIGCGPVLRGGQVTRSRADLWLRSSPTPEGRCCRGHAVQALAEAEVVAILTDPEGPVLPARLEQPRIHGPVAILTDPGGPVLHGGAADVAGSLWVGCDPHRPRRAGAAWRSRPGTRPRSGVAILTDPGGPVLLVRGDLAGAAVARVAILTDPGGPVLHPAAPPQARRRAVVAILTDPGGPVLPAHRRPSGRPGPRCDPHRPRRAGAARVARAVGERLFLMLRSSPTPERRTRRCRRTGCDPHRPRRAGAALTGTTNAAYGSKLRSSPTPEGRCCPAQSTWKDPCCPRRCDPHRPRRAGAANTYRTHWQNILKLRSSPTPEGRCCPEGVLVDLQQDQAVAILTDPGGPVLLTAAPARPGPC
jgi:hypothetical protein